MKSTQFPFLEQKHDGGEWRVTSPFGPRKLNGRSQFHVGIDLGTYTYTKVFAPFDGVVTDIRYSSSGGNMVFLRRDNGDVLRLLHLVTLPTHIRVGQRVKQGEFVCQTGNTGASTGAHLHLDISVNGILVNPEPYFRAIGMIK